MATHDPKKLSPLTTHWHNRSLSSINSDAATFHSAHATNPGSHIELETQPPISSKPLPKPQRKQHQPPPPKPHIQEPQLESTRMDRSDSGYEEGRSSTEGRERSSSRPQSTSSRTNRDRRSSPRTSTSTPSARPTNRPTQRRNRRSSPSQTSTSSINNNNTTNSSSSNGPRRSTSEWRAGAPRPSLHARHTTPYTRSTISAQYPAQYFHFPPISLASDPASSQANENQNKEPEAPVSPRTPPPATVQYWTSDSTRRLEYAAIDAASKGVRGFVIKLIPDCFLPSKAKRRRFHDEEDDDASDAGSVRRYRLNLPEENLDKERQDVRVKEGGCGRPGFLRRWTTFGYGGGRKKKS